MRNRMLVMLLCSILLTFATATLAQEDGEATPEPNFEATAEPENVGTEPVQGIIVIGADIEETPEPASEILDVEETAEGVVEADEQASDAVAVEETEESEEESAALGADLLILLMGLGGVMAVGAVMIGRGAFTANDTAA